MKTLLLLTLALGSLAAHASKVSTNYEAKYLNENLTVSIVKPKFSNPSGEGALLLSVNSDYDGVCKLYGLNSYVQFSELNFNAGTGNNVVIDSSSSFKRFESNIDQFTIGTITCNPAKNLPVPVSENYEDRFDNDDESVTIKTPQFRMNGQNLYISENSELTGVCKLYGLSSYVQNSLFRLSVDKGNSVLVDTSSRFNNFDSNQEVYAIGSLICR